MFIKKLNLNSGVKAALFSGARQNAALVYKIVPQATEAFYWAIGCSERANVQQYTYEPVDGPFGKSTPIMEALPIEARYSSLVQNHPEVEQYFNEFGLSQYQGTIYDANWGVHRHAYDVDRQHSLTLIDDPAARGSIAKFYRNPESDRSPSPDHLYATIDIEHPDLELVHEEPIEPFEAYVINTWNWHSFITPGLENSQRAGFSPVRVLCHLLIPNNCAVDSQAQDFVQRMESHVLR